VNPTRIARWVWGPGAGPWIARLPLIPASLLYGATMTLRAAVYRGGLLAVTRLPRPSVAVGNVSLGGTGKTPLAAWIARQYISRGMRPAILLRGYGGDEALVHHRLVPEAIVAPDADRAAAAGRAVAAGADVFVLDDAFQLLRVARDLNIAVVSADDVEAARWPVPAGPWREGPASLGRADVIVVTRKAAGKASALALADRLAADWPGATVALAHLAWERLEGLESGARVAATALAGRRVVAAAGIANPSAFRAQLEATGASVQLLAYEDHHAYTPEDVARLAQAARHADYVVVTEKDAVKLRGRWPEGVPEPLVALLEVQWERNGPAVERALQAVLPPGRAPEG
jgi:tetraacyldisaccharide 4'-kinase